MNTTDEIMDLAEDYRTARGIDEKRRYLALVAAVNALVEQAKWAHHTPALLTDADAAADLAGVARPGAEPVAWLTEAEDGTVMLWPDFTEACSHCDDDAEPQPLYTAPPQASQPTQDAVDADMPLDKDALAQLIAPMLYGTYHCTRVWEAWNVGTMSRRDFEPVDESDTPYEIADAILAAIAAQKGKP